MADGKKYSVFGKTLPPYIKVGEIDAEVEIKQGDNWTNYKVTDIFIDGKSVKAQQGFNRGKSPEELELSRRSFALAYAKDLVVAATLDISDILDKATEFYNWMQVNPTAAVKETKETTTTAPKTIPTSETEIDYIPITTEQKERLKELQEKLPGRMKELIKKFGWEVATVSKLTEGQAKHLIEEMEKELSLLYPKAGE